MLRYFFKISPHSPINYKASGKMINKYCRKSQYLSVDMDGDLVMMDLEKGEYYGISGIGSDIWDILESPKSLREISDRICEIYEVETAAADAYIQELINSLLESDLIEMLPADG